jgi:hypothetical protein
MDASYAKLPAAGKMMPACSRAQVDFLYGWCWKLYPDRTV